MELARPAFADSGRVAGRDVPDMGGEPVVGEECVEPVHQPITGDLGDDGRRRDRSALLVSVHDRRVGGRGRPEPEAVDETRLGRRAELPEDGAEPGEVRAVQPGAVDLAV